MLKNIKLPVHRQSEQLSAVNESIQLNYTSFVMDVSGNRTQTFLQLEFPYAHETRDKNNAIGMLWWLLITLITFNCVILCSPVCCMQNVASLACEWFVASLIFMCTKGLSKMEI